MKFFSYLLLSYIIKYIITEEYCDKDKSCETCTFCGKDTNDYCSCNFNNTYCLKLDNKSVYFSSDFFLFYTKLRKALKPGGYFILTDYFAENEEQEEYFRNELLRIRKEQNLADDIFYHYDTPLTVEHEKEALLAAGFTSVEELNSWEVTHTLKAVI